MSTARTDQCDNRHVNIAHGPTTNVTTAMSTAPKDPTGNLAPAMSTTCTHPSCDIATATSATRTDPVHHANIIQRPLPSLLTPTCANQPPRRRRAGALRRPSQPSTRRFNAANHNTPTMVRNTVHRPANNDTPATPKSPKAGDRRACANTITPRDSKCCKADDDESSVAEGEGDEEEESEDETSQAAKAASSSSAEVNDTDSNKEEEEEEEEAPPEQTRPKKAKSAPIYTSSGPTCKQVLVNNALRGGRSMLAVLVTAPAYGGWSMSTNKVASENDLAIIRGCVLNMLSAEARESCFVGLPASKSFLHIIDVPWFSDVTKNILTTREHVEAVFKRSTLGCDIWMTGPVRLVRDSANATSGTAYFDIWDSQTGAKAKRVINRPLEIHGRGVILVLPAGLLV
ncbi:hypothetical protein BKA70DRAFT_1449717 [Coprinopsis sp. MPI-PUGE-AT-0042]|nr:hypothetical protein BKA70DRAFT_1449717 [Coprinopsis sp. MPI-PUGE-AT-0042]